MSRNSHAEWMVRAAGEKTGDTAPGVIEAARIAKAVTRGGRRAEVLHLDGGEWHLTQTREPEEQQR